MSPIIFECALMPTPPGGPNILSSAVLPAGTQNSVYTDTLLANGGTLPYTWSLVSGSFPTGVSLASNGVISGTPTTYGTFIVVIKCTDLNNLSSQKTFNLMISQQEAMLTITTSSPLPPVTQYVTYSETMNATGGSGTGYTWAIIAGSLNAGLTFSSAGVFGGNTSNTASMSITIQVTDSQSNVASKPFTLSVTVNPLTITTTSPLPNATAGTPYGTTMQATGGSETGYTWTITSGTLPTGISFSSSGVFSGTPATATTATLTISVTDSLSNTTSGSFSLTVNAASASVYEGANISVLQTSPTEQPFLNIAKISSSNGTNFTAWASSGSTTSDQINAVVDANGYMTSLPGGNKVTQYMNAGMNNEDPLGANGSGIGNGLPPGASVLYPSGSYTLTFQGACTLVLANDAVSGSLATTSTNVSVSGLTITSTMTSGQTGIVTFNVTPSTGGILLNITALPSNTNYFRNHSVVRTSQVANYNSGTLIDPNWVAMITNNGAGGFKRLRYMGSLLMTSAAPGTVLQQYQVPALTTGSSTTQTMTATWAMASGVYPCVLGNGNALDAAQNNTVTLVNGSATAVFSNAFTASVTAGNTNLWIQFFSGWSTRNQPQFAFWVAANGNGTPPMLPYETCLAMSAATGTDCWLNIPLWVNSFTGQLSSFCSGLAALILADIAANPGRKYWIELANEVPIEADEPYANMLAKTQLGVADFVSWMGLQTALISQALQTAMGANFSSIMIGPMTEFSTGNGITFLEAMMNGPSINGGVYPNSFLTNKPYTYFTHWGMAPYFISSTSSADFVTMMGVTTPLDDFFACMYGNVGTAANGSVTYSTTPAAGWVGSCLAAISTIKSGISSQPWASLPVHCYESGPGLSTSSFSNSAGSYTGPYGGGSYTTIRSALTALNLNAGRDQRMGYVLYDPTHQLSSNPGFLPAAVTAGVTTMNYFDSCQFESQFGNWGALSNVMQLPSSGGTATSAQIPKYAAIMNWINPTPYPTINYYVSATGNDSNNGLTPATAWAITSCVTSSPNFTHMTGKVVGFIGTLNVSTMMDSSSGGYKGAIQINGGSSGSPTCYVSCNSSGVYTQGAATITALTSGGLTGGGLSYPANGPMLTACTSANSPALTNQTGWVTIDGLVFTGYSFKAVRIGALSTGDGPSMTNPTVIQNCTFTGQNFTGISGSDNESSIWVDGVSTSGSCLIHNNWFHDNQGASGAGGDQHLSSIFLFNSANVTITNNTGYNSGGLAWGKDSKNQGATVAYNYVDMSMMTTGGAGGMAAFTDFTGAYNGTTGLTLTSNFYNNICVTYSAFNMVLAGAQEKETWQTPVNIYNNTIVAQNSSDVGIWAVSRNASQVSVYNNIIAGTAGGSSYGTYCMGTSSVAILDYNGDITAANYGIGASQGATGGYPTSTGTLATYQAAVTSGGGPAGLQAHAVSSNSPLFVATGTLAPYYQLQSGSPFKNKGSTTGTSAGAACDMGAWGGASPPTSIGCSFASAT